MTYEDALEAAGAKVLAFKSFGTWQGDWYAKVEYGGKTGWIRDYFGSCSGCDALEAALSASKDYSLSPEELCEFGKPYLEALLTQEEAEAEASEYIEWDLEAEKVLSWVKSHA